MARDELRDVRDTEFVETDGAGDESLGQKPADLRQIVDHRRARQASLLGEVLAECLLDAGPLRGANGDRGSGDDADLAQVLKERAHRRPVAAVRVASLPTRSNELGAPPFVDGTDLQPPASEPAAEGRDELQLLLLRGARVAAPVE